MTGQPMTMQPMTMQPMQPMQGRMTRQPILGNQMTGQQVVDLGYYSDQLEGLEYPTRGNSPAPFSHPSSVGGGKIKDKAKKYFYKLLVNPKTIYLKYKEHLYVKFNDYLLSVKKLQEYIYSKDIKQVKNSKKEEKKSK